MQQAVSWLKVKQFFSWPVMDLQLFKPTFKTKQNADVTKILRFSNIPHTVLLSPVHFIRHNYS
jgi:hypothetical protein